MISLDLRIDVSEAAALDEEATIALTVDLPDADTIGSPPVVCFAKPGGGYGRGYYTVDLPGPGTGAQAEWHAGRGWVFVSVDHLGVGDSSTRHDGARLDYSTLAAASQAAEREVLRRLADGTLADGFPIIAAPLVIGIGQSMGGCMTIVQQGRYHWYDGIGVLGYGAFHTQLPVPPGHSPVVVPWLPRDTLLGQPLVVVNGPQLAEARAGEPEAGPPMGWAFFYDDVDPDLVRTDLDDFPTRNGKVPSWASATLPTAVASSCLTPGCVLPEAAAVVAPVLVAVGERDVVADPKAEPRVYLSASSVDLFVCPRMGHMHNFAGTRRLLWERIETWAQWVATLKASAGG
jgi:pimeloyl-ACP methyl ester carboxylesterase